MMAMDLRQPESPALQALHQALLERKLDFQAKFPHLIEKYQESIIEIERVSHAHFEEIPEGTSVLQATLKQATNEYDKGQADRVLAVTHEEIESIFTKIAEFISSSGHDINQDELLYLEQQLSDIVGFTVSSQFENIALPYIWGKAKSLPHIKRHPTDNLDLHEYIHEATITNKRSVYGWLNLVQSTKEEIAIREQYSVTLPLLTFEHPELPSERFIQWFKYKKVLMINPQSKKMAVAQISNIVLPQQPKYALGLSPELSRNLETWRPPSQGNIFFLFVDDAQDKVPLGMLEYELTV